MRHRSFLIATGVALALASQDASAKGVLSGATGHAGAVAARSYAVPFALTGYPPLMADSGRAPDSPSGLLMPVPWLAGVAEPAVDSAVTRPFDPADIMYAVATACPGAGGAFPDTGCGVEGIPVAIPAGGPPASQPDSGVAGHPASAMPTPDPVPLAVLGAAMLAIGLIGCRPWHTPGRRPPLCQRGVYSRM
jgi:hypothetical protein